MTSNVSVDKSDLEIALQCLSAVLEGESFSAFPPNWRESTRRLSLKLKSERQAKHDHVAFFNEPEALAPLLEDGWQICDNPPFHELEPGELVFLHGDVRERYPMLVREGSVSLDGYYLFVDTGKGQWLDGPYMTGTEALRQVDLDPRIGWHPSHEIEEEISSYRHGAKLSTPVPLDAVEIVSVWQTRNGILFPTSDAGIPPEEMGKVLGIIAASQSDHFAHAQGIKQPKVLDVMQDAFNTFLGSPVSLRETVGTA